MVANGTYHVSPSDEVRSNSLWIGGNAIADAPGRSPSAPRPRRGDVRRRRRGRFRRGLSFEDGAHDQTWDGFRFTNMQRSTPGSSRSAGTCPGGRPTTDPAQHHDHLDLHGERHAPPTAPPSDHASTSSSAAGVGPHDLLFENITVDGRGNLASAFHFDHGDGTARTQVASSSAAFMSSARSRPSSCGCRSSTTSRSTASTSPRPVPRRPVRVGRCDRDRVQATSPRSAPATDGLLQHDGQPPAGRDLHERQPALTLGRAAAWAMLPARPSARAAPRRPGSCSNGVPVNRSEVIGQPPQVASRFGWARPTVSRIAAVLGIGRGSQWPDCSRASSSSPS